MTQLSTGVFYDGNIAAPIEIEGSGEIQVDPITTGQVLTRKYAVLRTNYQPPTPGFQPFVDGRLNSAYFVDEKVQKIEGSATFFNRRYATIPPNRTETRLVSFTYPGVSGFIGSAAFPSGWSPYAGGYPKTKLVQATVLYTYAIQKTILTDPGPIFTPTVALSNITYQGKIVDYYGSVYVSAGVQSLPGNKAQTVFVYQGATTPVTAATVIPWVISVEQRRFLGPIWEQAVVQFTNGLAF